MDQLHELNKIFASLVSRAKDHSEVSSYYIKQAQYHQDQAKLYTELAQAVDDLRRKFVLANI